MIGPESADRLLQAVSDVPEVGYTLRLFAMGLLAKQEGYDWCGVYRLEGNELLLDAYVGAATDHTRIPVGTGVCGTAVAEGKNQIVKDVRRIENYLSCSVDTRSEIVTLIKRQGAVIGQIDIDGHQEGAFDESDERFLVALGEILAEKW